MERRFSDWLPVKNVHLHKSLQYEQSEQRVGDFIFREKKRLEAAQSI